MASNYKKLGDYIRQVSNRNSDLSVTNLQGVSITKKFIPSIANTVGTNMATYKKVYRHQLAYGPVTSRNGDKISIALLDQDVAIISQAYTVFEVINHDELDPEYLMMWFRRPEFDRYARFKSHGSVREIFGWDEMCDVEFPVPDITQQRAIVKEYETVKTLISTYRKKNVKLLDMAQTIYGHITKETMTFASLRSLVKPNDTNLLAKHGLKTIQYLDTSSITQNRIDGYQILEPGKDIIPSRAKRVVKNGDVIYSTVRPNLEHYGIIYKPTDNVVVSTGFAVLSPHKISSEQLLLYLMSNDTTVYLQSIADMSTTTYPSIQIDDLLSLEMPIVSNPTEDQKLSNSLKVIISAVYVNYEKIKTLRNLSILIQNKMSITSGATL